MKNIYILLLLTLGYILGACSENERMTYDLSLHDIYYTLVSDTRDSLFISLLTADDVSTHTIEIKMLGDVLNTPERFSVEVVKEKSTAVEGIHYQKLPEYYEFPEGAFLYNMPVTLIKTAPELETQEVILTLRLKAGPHLGVAYGNRSDIRVKYSNMLRPPEGEGYYGDLTAFRSLFGEYSRTKHTMIIEMTGHDFWDGNYGNYGGRYGIYYEASYYTPYARMLYKIITENEIYDENGNLMTGWNVP